MAETVGPKILGEPLGMLLSVGFLDRGSLGLVCGVVGALVGQDSLPALEVKSVGAIRHNSVCSVDRVHLKNAGSDNIL